MERVLRIAMCIAIGYWIMNNLRLMFYYFKDRDYFLQKLESDEDSKQEVKNFFIMRLCADMIRSAMYYVMYMVMYQLTLALMTIGGIIE